jgi:ribonuclease BN (tRNA processing enzyme)
MNFVYKATDTDKIQNLKNQISEWLYSEQLEKIVASFGTAIPASKDIKKWLAWLVDFSSYWDYRKIQSSTKNNDSGENARWLIHNHEITSEQEEAVNNTKKFLGLVGIQEPSQHEYDYILILGGARLSCLLRPKYAAEIVQKHGIKAKAIVGLSGLREINDTEKSATITYSADAKTEYDLMNAGIEQSFGTSQYDEEKNVDLLNTNTAWAIRKYTAPIPIYSLAAPSFEPGTRRANTADTYQFFIERLRIKKHADILIITSQIYVPYQQLEAIRIMGIPYEVSVETIGFPNEWNAGMQGLQTSANYLQELRSALLSMDKLMNFLEEIV